MAVTEATAKVLSVPDKIYDFIPASWAGAIVRGVRAAISIILATVVSTVSDGSVFKEIHIINADQVPLAVSVLTPIVLGVDKWLRDHGFETQDPPPNLPTSSVVGEPIDGSVLVVAPAVPTAEPTTAEVTV